MAEEGLDRAGSVRAVFASRNRHKTEQVALLLPMVELIPLDEVAPGLELEEPFDTFELNALAKARAVVVAALPSTMYVIECTVIRVAA